MRRSRVWHYGWYVDQTSQWVLRTTRLERQRKHSLWLNHVWNFSLLDLQFKDTAPMATHGGALTLVDSSFANDSRCRRWSTWSAAW